jgi:hypothetical protein
MAHRRAESWHLALEFCLDFPIFRDELILVTGVCRTTTFKLEKEGKLSKPATRFGRKVFCLRESMLEIAIASGLQPPTESAIQITWKYLLDQRCKRSV